MSCLLILLLYLKWVKLNLIEYLTKDYWDAQFIPIVFLIVYLLGFTRDFLLPFQVSACLSWAWWRNITASSFTWYVA